MLSAILKVAFAAMLVVVALFFVVVNYSAVESRFECAGVVKRDKTERPITVFIKLDEFRWWVGLWSNSHGSLWLEAPNEHVEYYSHLRRAGHAYQIYADGSFRGNFSKLSNVLAIDMRPKGFFDGRCRLIDR
jgi:hypothetical protein